MKQPLAFPYRDRTDAPATAPLIAKPEKKLYDAVFSGPKGEINPMGLKVPGSIPVQLFPKTAVKWIIRTPSKGNAQFCAATFDNPEKAMAHVEHSLFERRETEWTQSDLLD